MSGFNIEAWHDFFAALVGAGAALAGLVFVAISINLQQLLHTRSVQGRAIEALSLLLSLSIVGLLALMPDQGAAQLGVELVAFGAILAAILIAVGLGASNMGGATRGQYMFRIALGQVVSWLIVVAGVSLLAGAFGGLYWLAAAAIAAILAGMLGAWVLLVEIVR